MSIKNLFKVSKPVSNKSISDMGSTVESQRLIEAKVSEQKRFVPYVDFSDPKDFVRYGLAEKYYQDSIVRIYSNYPFDGSLYEKQAFHNSSSNLDNYVFENHYPRTNGYIQLCRDGWGTGTGTTSGEGFTEPTNKKYIQITGSMNLGPTETRIGANLYDTARGRAANLKLDGNSGFTVEFWLKKGNLDATKTAKEVIFDLWNGATVTHAAGSDYGRLLVWLAPEVDPISTFKVTCVSGTVSACTNQTIGVADSSVDTGSILNDSWNHFAISGKNNGTGLILRLHKNGVLNDTRTVAVGAINEVTGAFVAHIGALRTKATPAEAPAGAAGYGKLSGSLDEFRYWKAQRTSEQVGKYWFTQVGGGTNTDPANTNLGVYYKFNEGITLTSSVDATVLDYSGRLSHGKWVGYAAGERETGSAMVQASASLSEFRDPIIYSHHYSVVQLYNDLTDKGRDYDIYNNSSLYRSFPGWVVDEDRENEGENLVKLTQIMGSYFDDLQLSIEHLPKIQSTDYVSASFIPAPFVDRQLRGAGFITPEIFAEADILNKFMSRDNVREFSDNMVHVKNLIYQNIYSNLSYIYKSKGTEKSFRNLIRCFGIDDELIKINMYSDNGVIELRNNYRPTTVKKKYADFNHTDRFSANVFQYPKTGDSNTVGYISGSLLQNEVSGNAMTIEAEVFFPKKLSEDNISYFPTTFLTASLFGAHTAKSVGTDTTWANPDSANFIVLAERDKVESKHVRFRLTGSSGGFMPSLTSSLFNDVYNNEKWNFAVRIRPNKYPFATRVSGTLNSDYAVEFCGFNSILDTVQNEFSVSSERITGSIEQFMSGSKRLFVGAQKTNFTGSGLLSSDAKISSFRCWMDYLPDEVIKAHSYDTENYGSDHPYQSAYLNQLNLEGIHVPKMETLMLHWDFSAVTGSDSAGQFIVDDISSGSVDMLSRYGWVGNVLKYQYPGLGNGFLANDDQVVDVEYISSAKQRLPESIGSDDMIEILDRDDDVFTRETRPITHFFAVEKSMYQTISEEMINLFATIVDFNNLIGEPVNRYRQKYKDMEKLRQLFFERIENVPDIEKYLDFYKWLDSSLSVMLQQLVPATAEMAGTVRNMVESHVLERNKYWTKFPTLEFKGSDIEAAAKSINEHLFDWEHGHAPIPAKERKNRLYWSRRAERDDAPLAELNGTSESRELIFSSSVQVFNRQKTTPYRLLVDKQEKIGFEENKAVDYYRAATEFSSVSKNYLFVTASSLIADNDCVDELSPTQKKKKEFKAVNIKDGSDSYVGSPGNMVMPFDIVSSSVSTGDRSLAAFADNVAIEGLHQDVYGTDKDAPLQGPFTEAHVGGHQHRHFSIESGSTTFDETTRPEGWRLFVEEDKLYLHGPEAIARGVADVNLPRAPYYREETAKRPVNIKNIVHKNYKNVYEVVQTSGRKYNNPSFVMSGGYDIGQGGDIIYGVASYAVPNRGANKHVIVERFSAPGGPETFAEESMDLEAAEYSVYNSINYRNLNVRNSLIDFQSGTMARFGFDGRLGAKANSLNYEGSASFHKVQRNTLYRVVTSGSRSDTYKTGVMEDNWFVQHPIPQDDRGYPWLSASIETMPDNGIISSEATYVSASDLGSYTVAGIRKFNGSYAEYLTEGGIDWQPETFVRLNYFIQEPVSASINTLGHATTLNWGNLNNGAFNTNFVDQIVNRTASLNSLINKRDGTYSRATWKQIRTGEHPVALAHKKENIISVMDSPKAIVLSSSGAGIQTVKAQRSPTFKNFTEPVASRAFPLIQTVETKNELVSIKNSYSNNLSLFSNASLNKILGISVATKQTYDKVLSLYSGEIKKEETSVKGFSSLIYKETVYPKEENLYKETIRGRTTFSIPYWRSSRGNRTETNRENSQGFTVNQSCWNLDARTSSVTAEAVSGTHNAEGELQNAYSTFFASPELDKNPSIPGNINPSVIRFNSASYDGGPTLLGSNPGCYQDCIQISGSINGAPAAFETWDDIIGTGGPDTFTISAWVNVTSSLSPPPDRETIVEFGNGNFGFYLTTGSVKTGPTAWTTRGLAFSASFDNVGDDSEWIAKTDVVTENEWAHIAVTVDKAEAVPAWAKLYSNGALVSNYLPVVAGNIRAIAPNICTIGSGTTTGDWGTFGYASPSPFMGMMSDIVIFNATLSAAEILELYNGGNPRSLYQHSRHPNLISWWRLGGGVGMYTGSLAAPYGDEIKRDFLLGWPGVVAGINGLGSPKIVSDSILYDVLESGSENNRIYDMAGSNDGIPQFGRRISQVAPPAADSLEFDHGLLGHAQVREKGWANNFKIGAQYARRTMEFVNTPWALKEIQAGAGTRFIRITGAAVPAGDTRWTAAEERGKQPSKETYAEFAVDVRAAAKDYTIIPEFRISELMEEYTDVDGLNFSKKKNGFLSLTGSTLSSSSDDDFFKTYSHGDFMKHFEVLDEDHKNFGEQKEITLKCKAFLKFLPYEGFYPQERTLQLAKLFSQSYGDYVHPRGYTESTYGNVGSTSESTASWRAFFNPFFGPGLLYNSIKAGMAVDYPVYNTVPNTLEDYKAGIGNIDFLSGGLADNPWYKNTILQALWEVSDGDGGRGPSFTTTGIYGWPLSSSVSQWYIDSLGSAYPLNSASYSNIISPVSVNPEVNDQQAEWSTVLASQFNKRLPFESLIEPENYVSKKPIWDMEPEYSASLRTNLSDPTTNQAAFWGGEGSQKYKLAMHNFLAEVPNFFLKDGELTTFASKPIPPTGIIIKSDQANKYFGMDISISNSNCKSLTDFYQRKNLPEFRALVDNFGLVSKEQMDKVKGVHTLMYSRDSAFGPPWVHADHHFTSSRSAFSYHHSYEPFTPSNFNGFAQARALFKPFRGAGNYTLDEIQSNLTMSFLRFPTDRTKIAGTFLTTQMMEWLALSGLDQNFSVSGSGDGVPHLYPRIAALAAAASNWQQLTSSINLFGKTKAKKVTYEKGYVEDFVPATKEDSQTEVSTLWTIYPKWETPILNFANATASVPGDSILAGTGSIARGMWHQYGHIPTGSEGYWFSVSDLPDVPLYTTGCVDTSVGNSCIWINRKENTLEERKTNASLYLYIRVAASLTNAWRFDLDGTPVIPVTDFALGNSNLECATNLADYINSSKKSGGDPSIYLKNRFTASAFIPKEHPWIDNGAIEQLPIAAVKITVRDVATPFINYPNYYAAGELGNSKLGGLGNLTGLPDSVTWALKGMGITSNDIEYGASGSFYGGKSPSYEVESLADLVGFKKSQQRLGSLAEEKVVKEAVVAIPFVETNGSKQFFAVPRRLITLAMGENKALEKEETPGKSIFGMVNSMKNYVFPPEMDFIANKKVDPFAMYIFEFEHKFTQEDLADIWQNLPPESYEKFETKEVTLSHELLSNEFFKGKLESNLRWMVFKVKQKAATNYYEKTPDFSDDEKYQFKTNSKDGVPAYSYNYPYDFFSLVELAKIEAEIKLGAKKPGEKK